MVAESKNARRKRLRRLEGQLKNLPALLLQLETLRRNNHQFWRDRFHIRELERSLKDLSEQYLKVCKELHDLRYPIIITPRADFPGLTHGVGTYRG